MDADLRAELLQHITCELFQTPKLRCDNRARAQVCATAGAVTLACRTNRRRIGMPVERVEIAASRCASHARSSFFPTPRALRELYSVTRLTTTCAAGRKNHRISIFRPHTRGPRRKSRCALVMYPPTLACDTWPWLDPSLRRLQVCCSCRAAAVRGGRRRGCLSSSPFCRCFES